MVNDFIQMLWRPDRAKIWTICWTLIPLRVLASSVDRVAVYRGPLKHIFPSFAPFVSRLASMDFRGVNLVYIWEPKSWTKPNIECSSTHTNPPSSLELESELINSVYEIWKLVCTFVQSDFENYIITIDRKSLHFLWWHWNWWLIIANFGNVK